MKTDVLVVGATSKAGRLLVGELAGQGQRVRAATRHPAAYDTLQGVEAIYFDYDDPASYAPAFADVRRAFIAARPADPASHRVVNPAIDAAKAAGVEQIVVLTAMGVEFAPETPLHTIEQHVFSAGLDYTILRPNWFNQNFSAGFIVPMITQAGGVFVPDAGALVSFVDARDIAAVAAQALVDAQHIGQAYTLTGPEAITHAAATQLIAEAAGRPLQFASISDDAMRESLRGAKWASAQIEMVVGLFAPIRAGFATAVSPDVERVLARSPIGFAQFAADYRTAWQ